ncbi:MAG: alpha-amylase family glycosyl hydrolase [PVC group bacterium]
MKKDLNTGSPSGLPEKERSSADPPSPFRLSRRLCNLFGVVRPAAADAPADVFDSAQLMAESINRRRNAAGHPERAVRGGEVSAICLIENILHHLTAEYRRRKNPRALEGAVKAAGKRVGNESLDQTLAGFIETLPGLEHPPPEIAAVEYLRKGSGDPPPRQEALNELLLLDLARRNPAFRPLDDLFRDRVLDDLAGPPEALVSQEEFYRGEPFFGPENLPLPEFLRMPVRAAPDSLPGQLDYIKENWIDLLSPDLLEVLMVTRDVIREEEKLRLAGAGPALPPVPAGDIGGDWIGEGARGHSGGREAYDRFSPDLDWMPRVVLLAKNIYVWLDQLSRRYGRPIARLDQIPDEELDCLVRWGFTSLWLIGLWERSPASRKIKRRCGNPEADASAYSLYDYVIAAELGGKAAIDNLKDRAWRRGIRVASDMVPNHMGIYSRWMIEHPGWFIQAPRPPFPNYRFTGPDLSDDPRVAVCLEDGYWNRSDAAVVFKRVDRESGEERYIYHGNDGTSMPWNDTAQLDFLQAEVREAVIRTIVHVARTFPVIRFDAAMVLARQHFHRLWYPPAGEGGAIPSRAGRGISAREFDRLFPREFWRDVVDRVAEEIPETLLLAEAFWMLEGYFVRSLGVHRVYNSAFMNMLKLEMNDQYRQVVKEVLEFNPQILKRFVNFMNNPDEATAVAQFGKGDKYFGVCTMMVTMPGLPLFGHGQIEGLTEKYGMEYRKAYWDEPVDGYLVKRHEEELFPLLKKRHLFSDVANFYLYDFFLEDGAVNEDVFAYSNRYENERSLIVYNNRFRNTSGWIRISVSRAETGVRGGKKLVRTDISRGLALRAADDDYTIFKDLRTGLEYIRSSREIREKGVSLMLRAYQTHVFADIREVRDDARGFLAKLCASLDGRGVDNINEALKRVHFAALYRTFRNLCSPDLFRRLFSLAGERASIDELTREVSALLASPGETFFTRALSQRGQTRDVTGEVERQVRFSAAVLLLAPSETLPHWTSSRYSRPALRQLISGIPGTVDDRLDFFRVILTWSLLATVGEALSSGKKSSPDFLWMKEWFLDEQVVRFFEDLGCGGETARRELSLIVILLRHLRRMEGVKTKNHLYLLEPVFKDSEVRRFLLYHWDNNILWFNKERLEELLFWLIAAATVVKSVRAWAGEEPPRVRGMVYHRAAETMLELAAQSGYRVKEFRKLLAARPRKRKSRKKSSSAPGPDADKTADSY